MEIKDIKSQSDWQDLFNRAGSPSFLQSWEWGEVQKRLGYDAVRLALFENPGDPLPKLIAQIISIKAKRGSMLFVPHGPIFINPVDRNGTFQIFAEELKKRARENSSDFIRIAFGELSSAENLKMLDNTGFRKAPIYMHAERMWVLDIKNKTEEQLLADMRKTTRYSIKKAAKEGVIIKFRTDERCLQDFWTIYKQTAEREKFSPFSENFLKAEYEEFAKTNNAVFIFAEHNGINLAGALILFTKTGAFYHQGASTHSKIPAPYLLQWEAIKFAKRRGCAFYNFWGILQEGRTPKNWSGLTLFKKGFGGSQIDFTITSDKPLSFKYYLTSAYERILAWKRGV